MRVIAIVTCVSLSGCALLGKSEPLAPRYFSPERVDASPASAPSTQGGAIRLGVIRAGLDIRQNLVMRTSEFELEYDEEQRWTERPESYLRRGLARELFERRGLHRVLSGPATTVELELLAFEEVVGPPRRARITVRVVVHDERAVRLERTLTEERPIEGGGAEDVVRALSDALARVVEVIAELAVGQLAPPP